MRLGGRMRMDLLHQLMNCSSVKRARGARGKIAIRSLHSVYEPGLPRIY